MKLVMFREPKMKAEMKSIIVAKFNPSTSTGFCSVAAISRSGRKREKMIVWAILCSSGEDCR